MSHLDPLSFFVGAIFGITLLVFCWTVISSIGKAGRW
jgi:hypothetical protein